MIRIAPQIFKTHDGQRPITYGVWIDEVFACWARCFCSAMKAANQLTTTGRGDNKPDRDLR